MMLLRLAEAASTFEPLKAGEDLVVTERYVLFLAAAPRWSANAAERLRLEPESVAETIEELHALVRAHGGTALTWKVANLATPADLADRLLAHGAVADAEPLAVAMALRKQPAPGPSAIAVSRVQTVDDFRTFVSITHEVFAIEERLPAELERIGREGAGDLADSRYVRYLAWLDGRAVGAASATFAESGAILHAGSTLAEARGRGAYRALVAARWKDAVRRGTPGLVTWAGSMSRPILRRLGFEEIGEQRILREDLGR
jgi:GNAT superfamily N-acetyltransferase